MLTLRAGERWQPRLLELIQEADVFQLFWSSNSMRSQYCQQEWEHALALRRPAFVRPLYWEDPLPEDMMLGLPPPALRELHFVKVRSSRLLPPPAPEPSESSRHGALDFGPDHLTTGAWPRPEQDETGVSHLGARPRPRDFLPRGPDPYPGLVVQVEGSSHALLTGSLYRVGRDPRSDIVLTDPRVSWAHAVLRAEGGTWFIEDLGSTNGTFVGSQRISRYRITQDCTLRFANPADAPVMTCSLAGPVGRPIRPPPGHASGWPVASGNPVGPGYGAAEQGPAPVAPPPDLPATLTGRGAPPSAPGDDAYAA